MHPYRLSLRWNSFVQSQCYMTGSALEGGILGFLRVYTSPVNSKSLEPRSSFFITVSSLFLVFGSDCMPREHASTSSDMLPSCHQLARSTQTVEHVLFQLPSKAYYGIQTTFIIPRWIFRKTRQLVRSGNGCYLFSFDMRSALHDVGSGFPV